MQLFLYTLLMWSKSDDKVIVTRMYKEGHMQFFFASCIWAIIYDT